MDDRSGVVGVFDVVRDVDCRILPGQLWRVPTAIQGISTSAEGNDGRLPPKRQ